MAQTAMPEQLTLPLEHRVARGVEDFLVTPANRRAVEWIDRWPDWPFTALVIVGPAASGKTHLAALWKARAEAAAVRLDDSDIEQAATIAASRSILIDDCDITTGGAGGQRALLQLYNLVRAAGRQMLLTASAPPTAWGIGLADLSSRLNSAMVVNIDSPDDVILSAIAMKGFADRQIAVDQSVIAYVVSRSERSFAGIARTVQALDEAAWAGKRPITIALARDVLNAMNAGTDGD
ncbi:MAG TPA: DnaA/Hda family protein [Alphaproteobacteria bacterium]|nr:DnaA/Hda family protein [Alphaproteobacteria bacterium]